MNTEELLKSILDNSNYNKIEESITEFTRQYIKKLLVDIIMYVDANISLGEISFCDNYQLDHEISQEIVGIPSVYSALDGNTKVLTAFAEAYSKLGIAAFDSLCKEALLDFLNVHNGLFVVDLSKQNICELSLDVPKQSDNYIVESQNALDGKIALIPITFSYGTITFLLLKKS